MNVILAKSAGFCWGVKRAVEKARTLAQTKTVRTDGPLIHNTEMLKRLENENIIETDDLSSIEDAVILIRAHGIPPERYKLLNSFNIQLEDATCPYVSKIQATIEKHADEDYEILIYGDRGHAEVIGLVGFAKNRGHVIKTEDDINKLPDFPKVCLVSQSTQNFEKLQIIAQHIKDKFDEVIFVDTICNATKDRQKELVDLSKKVDAMVVVGGKQSANTMQLVKLAEKFVPTFHIQNHEEIEPELLKQYQTIGLTAGASTPDFIIRKVKDTLEKI
ncbi:MAG: 4-hydroxy-3-methylbut-2-enyl diphosphate reductase [Kiritimatiellae bacterium]|jgi:(E)-4-hydroxy-3-methyl-but-2-enyl pyrophosphate reductase|nr:4-hydroxy-3-methylbut-2-enyl diphosphate reductase [Kiritimatiellia bacterium]